MPHPERREDFGEAAAALAHGWRRLGKRWRLTSWVESYAYTNW